MTQALSTVSHIRQRLRLTCDTVLLSRNTLHSRHERCLLSCTASICCFCYATQQTQAETAVPQNKHELRLLCHTTSTRFVLRKQHASARGFAQRTEAVLAVLHVSHMLWLSCDTTSTAWLHVITKKELEHESQQGRDDPSRSCLSLRFQTPGESLGAKGLYRLDV